MSYRLEDLYHFAVTDEVTEEQARLAAHKAVRDYMEEWFATHPNDYSIQSIFTAGCCAGRTIRGTINKHLKMAITLFEISDEQRRLNAMLEEAEGELTPELEEALEVNQFNLEAKAEDYRNAILMNESEIEAAKNERKRLDAFIKRKENANEAMKQRLKEAMLLFDTPKIQINGGVGGTLSFRKSEQVVIDDENAVPESFRKVTWTLDKTAIKQAIKDGENIEGAVIVENMNLQIK